MKFNSEFSSILSFFNIILLLILIFIEHSTYEWITGQIGVCQFELKAAAFIISAFVFAEQSLILENNQLFIKLSSIAISLFFMASAVSLINQHPYDEQWSSIFALCLAAISISYQSNGLTTIMLLLLVLFSIIYIEHNQIESAWMLYSNLILLYIMSFVFIRSISPMLFSSDHHINPNK